MATIAGVLLVMMCICCNIVVSSDYYDTLGVRRDATSKEIKTAFKKLVLKMHPDKNTADPDAEKKFVKINDAYEILKDESLRRQYDLHGEEGVKEGRERAQKQQQRQSWQYYKQDFDIYGEDREVITLSAADFKTAVENRGESVIWFVNFYSPRCSHCHDLAPTWRKLAKEMEGVIRIAAVNCQDSWNVCRHLRGYPSLYLYTKDGVSEYGGKRDINSMISFLMGRAPLAPVIPLISGSLKSAITQGNKPWLVSFCYKTDDCVGLSVLERVSLALSNMVYVGTVNCDTEERICEKLPADDSTNGFLIFFNLPSPSESLQAIISSGKRINTLVTQEIIFGVLKSLPQPPYLTDVQFQGLVTDIRESKAVPIVVLMSKGGVPLEFIKLKGINSEVEIKQLDCELYPDVCKSYFVTRYPTLIVIKRQGYERYHGNQDAADIAAFISQSLLSSLTEFTPHDFPSITNERVVVDFFAPWCPPCMQLLPELRKAAQEQTDIKFGTIDCAEHRTLCTQYNIRSYPNLIFYDKGKPHSSGGYKSKEEILEFMDFIINPTVIELDYTEWMNKIHNKKSDEVWFVDYFAPWCGPCMELMPNWYKLGKFMSQFNKTYIAKVDCTVNNKACQLSGIGGYPTMRVYVSNSKGRSNFEEYEGWGQLHDLKAWAMSHLPSDVEVLHSYNFKDKVLTSNQPWLVEFYNPACGPCQRFAPEYETLASKLKHKVRVGKVNCNKYYTLCYQAKLRGLPSVKFYSGARLSVEDISKGQAIPTTTSEEIFNHMMRHYPFLKTSFIRDEL